IAKRLNTATETAARRLAHLEADLRAACRPRARIALAPLLRRGQTSAALSISCSSSAALTTKTRLPRVRFQEGARHEQTQQSKLPFGHRGLDKACDSSSLL